MQTLGEGLCLLQTSVQGKGLELGAKPCHMAVTPALFPVSGLSAQPLQRIMGVKTETTSLSYLFLFLPSGTSDHEERLQTVVFGGVYDWTLCLTHVRQGLYH